MLPTGIKPAPESINVDTQTNIDNYDKYRDSDKAETDERRPDSRAFL